MADDGGVTGGEGAESGGSGEWLPIFDRVEAMVSKSQAEAEALAADRARLEAAVRVQRDSWEAAWRLQRTVEELQAAAREKDAEMDRLRAEAADARKKLQADAGRKMRWEAAFVELILGANQKLAELRDSDLEDSRNCAETPNSEDTVGHIASELSAELRKLKQAYETLSSKKDKEVCALLSERDSLGNLLDIMQQDYTELLKNKEVEAAQATEAALKLHQSVDELKVLAQRKDHEIGRLQAEAVEAKKNHDKDLCALVSEKDSVYNRLTIMQKDYTELLKNKNVLTRKMDHAIVILRAEAVGAKKNVQKMHSLVKEKDDEIQRLKGRHPESIQKHYKDICETHKKSRSGGPAATLRLKLKNTVLRHRVKEHCIYETKKVQKDGPEETTQKHRRASSMSNDCEMSGSDEDGDEQSESDEDGDEQSTSGGGDDDEQSRSGGGDDDGQSRSDEHEHSQSGSDKETTNNPILKPRGNHKRKRDACNAEAANGKSHSESNRSGDMSETKTVEKEGQEKTTQKRRQASSMSNDDEKSGSNENDDEQIGSDEDGEKQSGSDEDGDKQRGSDEDFDKQSGSDEDGDEQSGSDEDGDSDDDNEKLSETDEETAHNEHIRKIMGCRWLWSAPAPLRQRKLRISDGRRYLVCTGHWGKYVKAVNDSLVDKPDKHKEFVRFLRDFEDWRVRDVARTMKVILDGQPKLIRQFNQFLPNKCQIWVKEEEEKQQPEVEEPHQPGVPPSPSASAAADLIKLKEAELERKWCGK